MFRLVDRCWRRDWRERGIRPRIAATNGAAAVQERAMVNRKRGLFHSYPIKALYIVELMAAVVCVIPSPICRCPGPCLHSLISCKGDIRRLSCSHRTEKRHMDGRCRRKGN